jgi:hypothetical protein
MIAGIGRGLLRTRVQRVWSHMSMSRKGLSTRDGRSAHRTHEHGGTACGKAKDLALAWKRMWTWIWTGINPPKDGGARCDVLHVSAARRERLYSAVEHRIGITYVYASSRRVPVQYMRRGARARTDVNNARAGRRGLEFLRCRGARACVCGGPRVGGRVVCTRG